MAILSDYTAGTVSVSANGTAVTGTGTAWVTAQFKEGDWFIANGWVNVIASVNTNTSLTLAMPWRGGALSGASYRLRYMSDGSRASAQARQLIDLLGGTGTIEALAGLTGAPNTLPYFTGAGTADITALTSAARSILGLAGAANTVPYYTGANAAALTAFTALGRNLVGSEDVLSAIDKLGPVLGGNSVPQPASAGVGLTNGDFNTITVSGVYTTAGEWTNAPPNVTGNAVGILVVLRRLYSNLWYQIHYQGGQVWMRYTQTTNAADWPNPWVRVLSPMVGSVAQSSGVPTGAIIERGSNANGEYVRYADGTQICWFIGIPLDVSVASGSLFRSSNNGELWTFPINFSGSFPIFSHASAQNNNRWATIGTNTSTIARVHHWSTASSATMINSSLVAIGRWF